MLLHGLLPLHKKTDVDTTNVVVIVAATAAVYQTFIVIGCWGVFVYMFAAPFYRKCIAGKEQKTEAEVETFLLTLRVSILGNKRILFSFSSFCFISLFFVRIVTVLLQLLEQGRNVLLCILIKMCMLKKIYIFGRRLNLVIVTKKVYI